MRRGSLDSGPLGPTLVGDLAGRNVENRVERIDPAGVDRAVRRSATT
jgi:hypothetical protein